MTKSCTKFKHAFNIGAGPNIICMKNFEIFFRAINYLLPMVFVKGTEEAPYLFGDDDLKPEIHFDDFFISKYTITQQVWEYVMGNNPSTSKGTNKPVDTVSYDSIRSNKGFLEKLNGLQELKESVPTALSFRLPSETEWEYAARGGKHWRDGFQFSGSNDIDLVAWYENNAGKITNPAVLRHLKNTEKGTTTHEVGRKAANQLGIFDMSGNVWEWCEDYFQKDPNRIPVDGSPCRFESAERVLRGGCHHNWPIHCTVHKRYAITPDAADGCIGFRIVASGK